jgi:hypothetical protein
MKRPDKQWNKTKGRMIAASNMRAQNKEIEILTDPAPPNFVSPVNK